MGIAALLLGKLSVRVREIIHSECDLRGDVNRFTWFFQRLFWFLSTPKFI